MSFALGKPVLIGYRKQIIRDTAYRSSPLGMEKGGESWYYTVCLLSLATYAPAVTQELRRLQR